jgi:hypothetical protein
MTFLNLIGSNPQFLETRAGISGVVSSSHRPLRQRFLCRSCAPLLSFEQDFSRLPVTRKLFHSELTRL